MSKFDTIFEKTMCFINEREYVDSTFLDNVRLLIKTLKDNDFISSKKDTETIVSDIMSQPNNVKEVILDTQNQALPPFKLTLKQDTDSESFSVTAINVRKPQEQKEFKNSMLETIFDDVVNYIKTATLAGIAPEASVETLPTAQGANAQPGQTQSELPK